MPAPGGFDESNIEGAANVLAVMGKNGAQRIVFASAADVYGAYLGDRRFGESDGSRPLTVAARQRIRVENMLASSGMQWVAIRSAPIVGRGIDNQLRRFLASPGLIALAGSRRRRLQVVHIDDALELFIRAILGTAVTSGPVNLAAPDEITLDEVAAVVRRSVIPLSASAFRVARSASRRRAVAASWLDGLELLQNTALLDTACLRDRWHLDPVWNAAECIDDVALAVRGRVAIGNKLLSVPWRIARIQDIPPADAAAPDGVVPHKVGPPGSIGEFDTPIDPRFPTFVATNLSEALPGPFSPASASVSVRGMRAGGVAIAQRLRPGGLHQHEIAARTVGAFGHRLYLAITSSYSMAETVPFVQPMTVLGQFFGQRVTGLPVFGTQRPPPPPGSRVTRRLRGFSLFGLNLAGLTAGAKRDTREFATDVDRLERLAGDDLGRFDDRYLLCLILLARDHVVHGWVLVSGSIMLCNACNVIMRVVCGRDTPTPAGPGLVSMQLLDALGRLGVAARRTTEAAQLVTAPDVTLEALATDAPQLHAALHAELTLIGHRGPAEIELQSNTYADSPELLLRMLAKALVAPTTPQTQKWSIPLRARPVARLSALHVRDRELRRDKTVRANWVLRRLLREYGHRLTTRGVFDTPDDVFYLLVDELAAPPPDVPTLVASRRAEQARLATIVPPPGFSGDWEASRPVALLRAGETLQGQGVSSGRVRGSVRIVTPHNLDDLQPGEILVAEVTDVGYTAAFSYAAAVVTDLGGLMSHAAIVAREFGIPCVVDAHDATRRLRNGALIEVDGATGQLHVLSLPTIDQ